MRSRFRFKMLVVPRWSSTLTHVPLKDFTDVYSPYSSRVVPTWSVGVAKLLKVRFDVHKILLTIVFKVSNEYVVRWLNLNDRELQFHKQTRWV